MEGAALPAPVAEGDLQRTPFAHVLLHVLQRSLTGTLVIWPEPGPDGARPRGQDRIRFQQGFPDAARFLHNAVAMDRGLLPLFTRINAPYAFYEADMLGSDGLLTGHVDPVALITASLRGAARDDAIEHVLSRFGNAAVRVKPGTDLQRYGLNPKEAAIVNFMLASPDSVPSLIDSSGNARLARRLLYLLTVTRALEPFQVSARPAAVSRTPSTDNLPVPPRLSGPPRRPGSSGEYETAQVSSLPPARISSSGGFPAASPQSGAPDRRSVVPKADPIPTPPANLSEEHHARWESIRAKVETIETQNYFEMLGLTKDATGTSAQDAYFKLVKKWHPDRLPAELDMLRPWVDRVFYYMTRAKDVLIDEGERMEYLRSVLQGGGTPESERRVNDIVQAALEFQKAEVLFRRKDYTGALELVREAKELNSEESDFYAFEAWAMFHLHTAEDAPYSQMLAATTKAIKLRPNSDKAHFYRGTILKRKGDVDNALSHFRKAAELNPKNLDAVREVRVAKMRGVTRSSRAPADKSSAAPGLFSKIFGSPKKGKR